MRAKSPPDELPRAFNRQPVHKRFAIVLAGPLANFLLAIFVYWLLFMHGVPGSRPVIDAPLPADAGSGIPRWRNHRQDCRAPGAYVGGGAGSRLLKRAVAGDNVEDRSA